MALSTPMHEAAAVVEAFGTWGLKVHAVAYLQGAEATGWHLTVTLDDAVSARIDYDASTATATATATVAVGDAEAEQLALTKKVWLINADRIARTAKQMRATRHHCVSTI